MSDGYPPPPPIPPPPPLSTPPSDPVRYVGLRILIGAGIGFLLAIGLCGAAAVTGGVRGSVAGTLAMGGVGVLVLSGIGLIVGVITLVIELIVRR